MRRVGGLFEAATSVEALYQGYLDARKGKRATRSCMDFERRLGAQLEQLHQTLVDGSYRPLPYNSFIIAEPKPRQISAPAFRDRVVQHAVYNVIRPIYDRTFIHQSFACRHGKGMHMASDYVQKSLQAVPRSSYVLQMDISRFYYSINREVLAELLSRKLKDRRLLALMGKFNAHSTPRGVPIGNLLSQLFALVYLNPMDHYIKRELKVRRYCRYVDDFILFGLSRAEALEHRDAVAEFLRSRLGLQLSRASIARASRGVNFCGYRTWASRRFVRRHALFNFRRAVRKDSDASVASMLGHARRTASHSHMIRHLQERSHALYRRLPESVRRPHHV